MKITATAAAAAEEEGKMYSVVHVMLKTENFDCLADCIVIFGLFASFFFVLLFFTIFLCRNEISVLMMK